MSNGINSKDMDGIIKIYSWDTYSSACKHIDSSSIIYHGSGIPIALRPFFSAENMNRGEKINLKLIDDNIGKVYSAYITMEGNSKTRLPRTRIIWDSELSFYIKSIYGNNNKKLCLNFVKSSKKNSYYISITDVGNHREII